LERIKTKAKMAKFFSRHIPEATEDIHKKLRTANSKSEISTQIRSTVNSTETLSEPVGSVFGNNNFAQPPDQMLPSVT
jgi:hypothetical protein